MAHPDDPFPRDDFTGYDRWKSTDEAADDAARRERRRSPVWPNRLRTLDERRAYHATVCGGRFVETHTRRGWIPCTEPGCRDRHLGAHTHTTAPEPCVHVYRCADCGRGYETDSSD